MSRRPPHSDIRPGDWTDRNLPHGLRPYLRLMRLDRPIGTWLLLWPCLWSLALASGGMPNLWHALLFAVGALIMRGAGCVVNDLCDRNLDGAVERTATRPLASRQLTPLLAVMFLLFLLLLGLLVLLNFNSFTVWLGIASLPIVFIYPLVKRFFFAPQLVLGLAFNWGALMGWAATKGSLDWPALLLYVGGIFWTLGYDTIYAHQDKKDDYLIGIHSLALYLKDKSRGFIAGFYTLFLALTALAATVNGAGMLFYLIFAGALAHAVWQLASWNMDDPANCLVRFKSNHTLGLIVFAAILLDRVGA
ncbi:MAG: 4-hydroxybenzoate octaprenyltransferase [Bdellovibrionales bacterium]